MTTQCTVVWPWYLIMPGGIQSTKNLCMDAKGSRNAWCVGWGGSGSTTEQIAPSRSFSCTLESLAIGVKKRDDDETLCSTRWNLVLDVLAASSSRWMPSNVFLKQCRRPEATQRTEVAHTTPFPFSNNLMVEAQTHCVRDTALSMSLLYFVRTSWKWNHGLTKPSALSHQAFAALLEMCLWRP